MIPPETGNTPAASVAAGADAVAILMALRKQRRRPATVKAAPLENQIQRAIMDRLETIPYLKIERNNRGAKRHIRFGLGDGAADLVGVVKIPLILTLVFPDNGEPTQDRIEIGRFFALEIKLPGKEMEPHQVKWAEGVRAMGGYVGCAHSVEEALEHVRLAREV